MKILVVSDTHGRHANLRKVIQREKPIDLLLHMGDVEDCQQEISDMAGCPVEIVMGNNDFFSRLPEQRLLRIGSHLVWMTHGHRFHIYSGTEHIRREARQRGADVVMFGHTHVPCLYEEEDLITMNPGSISFPRQMGHEPSYIVGNLDESGKLKFELKFL